MNLSKAQNLLLLSSEIGHKISLLRGSYGEPNAELDHMAECLATFAGSVIDEVSDKNRP